MELRVRIHFSASLPPKFAQVRAPTTKGRLSASFRLRPDSRASANLSTLVRARGNVGFTQDAALRELHFGPCVLARPAPQHAVGRLSTELAQNDELTPDPRSILRRYQAQPEHLTYRATDASRDKESPCYPSCRLPH